MYTVLIEKFFIVNAIYRLFDIMFSLRVDII